MYVRTNEVTSALLELLSQLKTKIPLSAQQEIVPELYILCLINSLEVLLRSKVKSTSVHFVMIMTLLQKRKDQRGKIEEIRDIIVHRDTK